MASKSDIASLWDQALRDYRNEVGQGKELDRGLTVTQIIMEQQREYQRFATYRHDGGKTDKLRGLIAKNSDHIQKAAEGIANAASVSFPPSSAILTAFTLVLKASQNVSQDYDLIESFFDIMDSFLQRLTLLEGKMPKEAAYQRMLMAVFCSLLRMCGIASNAVKVGRFKKWAKALVDGNDSKLKTGYDEVHENISRLEKGTAVKTLASAIETSEDVKSIQLTLQQSNVMMKQGFQQVMDVAIDVKITGKESLALARESAERDKDTQATARRTEDMVKEWMRRQQAPDSNHKPDHGAHRSLVIEVIKDRLSPPRDLDIKLSAKDWEGRYVKNTFNWIEKDDIYRGLKEESIQFLSITGELGMGKSFLTRSLYNRLLNNYESQFDDSTSVAYFAFREDVEESGTMVLNMLRWCCIQIAEKNRRYQGDIHAEMMKKDWSDEEDQLWPQLFRSKFDRGSDRRLILILNGVEDILPADRERLIGYMQEALDQRLRINFVFANHSSIESTFEGLKPNRLELSKEKIHHDLWLVTVARMETMPYLKKLPREMRRKRIATRLRNKADGFRYVDHMVRKLNAMGRESVILKELDQLPVSTTDIYEQLLDECRRHRSPGELELLRNLFAWLAYSQGTFASLTLRSAKLLLKIVSRDSSVSLEDELDGSLSRLILMQNVGERDDKETDTSDTESITGEENEDNDDISLKSTDGIDSILYFQERSLRDYFRNVTTDEADGLKFTATSAHAMMFRMLTSILTVSPRNMGEEERVGLPHLHIYASRRWMKHLHEIDISESTEAQTRTVVEGLYSIFANRNQSLQVIERYSDFDVEDSPSEANIFGKTSKDIESGLATVVKWAERATRLPSGILSDEASEWVRSVMRNPARVFLMTARGHIGNWFVAETRYTADKSFRFAYYALWEAHARNLPELKQNPVLEKFFTAPGRELDTVDDEAFETVANAFWDIPKTPQTYKRIAMALEMDERYNAALKQLNLGLEIAGDNRDRFDLKVSIGRTLFTHEEDEKQKRAASAPDSSDVMSPVSRGNLSEALDEINAALAIAPTFSAKAGEDSEIKGTLIEIYQIKARIEIKLGQQERALESIQHAAKLPDSIIYYLVKLIAEFGEVKAWDCIIKMVKLMPKNRYWTAWLAQESHSTLQMAAKEMGEVPYLIEVYESHIKALDNMGDGSTFTRLGYANFTDLVIKDHAKARQLLREVMDPKREGIAWTTVASWQIGEILLEEFRNSTDLQQKKSLLDEMNNLVQTVVEQQGQEFDPSQSQLFVVLALMTRKLGPALEFHARVEASFQGCMQTLTDLTAGNDEDSFRLLAKLLSLVPGLEREAQIAATCQFYIIDRDIYEREQQADQKEEKPDETSAPLTNGEAEAAPAPAPAAETPAEDTKPADQNIPNGPVATPIKYDTLSTGGYCNGCNKDIVTCLDGGAVYLCYFCTNMDLCDECYAKKLKREEAGEEPDWSVLCWKGHRHVKAPAEGWKGIKDGVMYLDDEEIGFVAWLERLREVRWKEAWERYWLDEGL